MTDIQQKLAASKLPLVPHLETIAAALEDRGVAVVRSDPGSGKSTLIPLALLDRSDLERGSQTPGKPAGTPGRILMLEPRRAAALGIASRMAELLGEDCGDRVGYSVRLRRQVSRNTRIEVVTEGLLVRRLQNDPDLRGVSTVIFDEFHERSVHTDLALALLLDLRRLGSPISILIMSATMDALGIGEFIDRLETGTSLGKVPVIDCPGRVFPVSTEYRPIPEKGRLGPETATVIRDILAEAGPSCGPGPASGVGPTSDFGPVSGSGVDASSGGNVLVFLPGKREIAEAAASLKNAGLGEAFEILSLYGGLPLAEQRQVLGAGKDDRRRIILSTNVAETGLTVPGITLVVDAGYARIDRYHLPTGMNRLILEPVSRRSADQRAGRAGRLLPGRCVRLWAENAWRPEDTDHEILRIDLSGLVLECLLWGVRKRDELPWLEMPPEAAWDRAVVLLQDLGAADRKLKVSGRGKEILKLGLEPRLGMLCIAGRDRGKPALGCAAAAILSERPGPVSPDSAASFQADFGERLRSLRLNPGSPWTRTVTESAADLLKRLGHPHTHLTWDIQDEADAGELLAAAFPDRICRHQESGKYRFASGREALVQGAAEGWGANQEWLVAAEVDAGERTGYIRLAAPVSPETALSVLENQLETDEEIEWKGLIPRSVVILRAGRLILSRDQKPSSRWGVIRGLPALLEHQGLGILPWEEDRGEARRLMERLRFFAERSNAVTKTDWSDEALIREAGEWLGPFIWEGRDSGKGPIIDGKGLAQALAARLGWELKRRLDAEVPDSFALPRGRKGHIEYGSGEPVLSLRLQDAFGITGEPRILGVPVVFCLLSPANRPIQITRDLPGFWKGSYAGVRKEMRGRYPKHNWPEPGELFSDS
jgi:ATP-dependent helicase HrpB